MNKSTKTTKKKKVLFLKFNISFLILFKKLPPLSPKMQQRPVTERANELTTELDISSPEKFIHLLSLSDHQIFEGFEDFPSMIDISDKVAAASEAISQAMISAAASATSEDGKKKKKVRIVMAGAGTSGRIAWVVSKDVNAVMKSKGLDPCCRYLIAGDDLVNEP